MNHNINRAVRSLPAVILMVGVGLLYSHKISVDEFTASAKALIGFSRIEYAQSKEKKKVLQQKSDRRKGS
ncbi:MULTISPECIES: hypothetical protein [unclassified Microcoleus]|uniref:hypothetical protein n=1 Tax=unclassified Microcoleus TaxID=2642155 RepID=UPI002FD5CF7D